MATVQREAGASRARYAVRPSSWKRTDAVCQRISVYTASHLGVVISVWAMPQRTIFLCFWKTLGVMPSYRPQQRLHAQTNSCGSRVFGIIQLPTLYEAHPLPDPSDERE